jgi:hypothetical protein
VAYETDLDYARETTLGVADGYLGDEMAARIARYRERLAETPVELEVQDCRPSTSSRRSPRSSSGCDTSSTRSAVSAYETSCTNASSRRSTRNRSA